MSKQEFMACLEAFADAPTDLSPVLANAIEAEIKQIVISHDLHMGNAIVVLSRVLRDAIRAGGG